MGHKPEISDLGLCKPLNEEANSKNTKVYGVLPYVSPEVINGKPYTQPADIYSFGILMSEVITGIPPYNNIPHDKDLSFKITCGLRPELPKQTPKLIVDLFNKCLDAQPLNRPSAKETCKLLDEWIFCIMDEQEDSEFYIQCKENEGDLSVENEEDLGVKNDSKLSYVRHPQAFY